MYNIEMSDEARRREGRPDDCGRTATKIKERSNRLHREKERAREGGRPHSSITGLSSLPMIVPPSDGRARRLTAKCLEAPATEGRRRDNFCARRHTV